MTITSNSANYNTQRDIIINKALRIIGTLGTGESADPTKITECAIALNDLVKELNADGMPTWKIKTYQMALTQGKNTYSIGIDASGSAPDINQDAPLKFLQAWTIRNNLTSNINIITRDRYNEYGDKTTQGDVNQVWYNPPGALAGTAYPGEQQGTIVVYQTPSADVATNVTLNFTGQVSFEDFDAATDVPDFPSYWFNAISWLLAADLAYEDGIPFTERSMIAKRAQEKKDLALSFGTEEGSMFLQPAQKWGAR